MSKTHDQSDFLKYFLKIQPALRGYLYAAVRDPVETDEMLQEVSLVLWRKFGEFDRTRNFNAWAMGIARFQILKQRQSHARSKLVLSEEAVAALATTDEDPDLEDERMSHLRKCLDKLPSRDRMVITLRLEKRQSMAEIGTYLRKSEAAVQMIMMRVRRWLRTCIEKSMVLESAGVS